MWTTGPYPCAWKLINSHQPWLLALRSIWITAHLQILMHLSAIFVSWFSTLPPHMCFRFSCIGIYHGLTFQVPPWYFPSHSCTSSKGKRYFRYTPSLPFSAGSSCSGQGCHKVVVVINLLSALSCHSLWESDSNQRGTFHKERKIIPTIRTKSDLRKWHFMQFNN